ncbi:hypothetical protein ABZ820_39770 [Streptomyces diacarni]|uniref:hypothetical protein n=1 Tax=Streptomyces diacarni TaxID=2800381 RepID=UPI0033C5EFA9
MRLSACMRVLNGLAPSQVRVARYALVRPGQDPAVRLAQAQAAILREDWQETTATFDDIATDPQIRPQFARLCGAIRRRELHGIVATSRTDISTFHGVYQDALEAVRVCGGFLALARDETTA